jgi:hypothetical protein
MVLSQMPFLTFGKRASSFTEMRKRKMRRLYKTGTGIAAALLFCGVLQGCELVPDRTADANRPTASTPTSPHPASTSGDYLTITNTEYVNGKSPEGGMVMRVYTYDLASGKLAKVNDVPYTSQYPLTVVSKADHKLYYSADVDDKGDQLFAYDLLDRKTEQLSNDLFAINHIIPTTPEGPLIVVAAKKGKRVLQTAFYEKKTKRLEFIDEQDTDTNTWTAGYNPDSNKTYLVQYSDKEDYEKLMYANKTQTPMVPANHTVIEIDNATRQKRKIIELENEQIMGISARGGQLLLVTSPKINQPPVEFSLVDIDTGTRRKLDLPITTRRNAYLSKDGKGIYLLGGSTDPTRNKERGIYYYNLQTGELKEIFLQKEGGFINNFMYITSMDRAK